MKCIRCGGTLGPPEQMTVPFRSLPGVMLAGIEGQRCPTCGDIEYEIPRIEELIRALTDSIIRKETGLTSHEVRFLRKALGWSGVDLAKRLGVASETVSRWESGAASINTTADRLLRMFVAHERPVEDYGLEHMVLVRGKEAMPFSCVIELMEHDWVFSPPASQAGTVLPAMIAAKKVEGLRGARR